MKNEFIAYDKKKKCFIPPALVALDGDGDVLLYEEDGFYNVYDNHIEILEYSGKKDRIGTKLYKGDIIHVELDRYTRTNDHFAHLEEKTVIGVVVIRPSEGAKILVKKVIPNTSLGITKGRTLRIKEDKDVRIGHIYTNPELIEEDSEENKDKC